MDTEFSDVTSLNTGFSGFSTTHINCKKDLYRCSNKLMTFYNTFEASQYVAYLVDGIIGYIIGIVKIIMRTAKKGTSQTEGSPKVVLGFSTISAAE